MTRVRAEGRAAATVWWQVLGGWARSGLVAAAAALVLALALVLYQKSAESRAGYAGIESGTPAVAPDSLTVPTGALSETDGADARGATFRDVISH